MYFFILSDYIQSTSPFRVILQYIFLDIIMFRADISQITLDIRMSVRPMCSPSRKSSSTQYIFSGFAYVIEKCIHFYFIYRLLLLQFVLGWAIFYHKSPGLLDFAPHAR